MAVLYYIFIDNVVLSRFYFFTISNEDIIRRNIIMILETNYIVATDIDNIIKSISVLVALKLIIMFTAIDTFFYSRDYDSIIKYYL